MAPALGGLALAFSPACGEEDDGVTYDDDVKPLFNQRCTICHRPGGTSGMDIQNPYGPEGLVNFTSQHDVATPAIVVPGEPDQSFLIAKIADPSLGLLPPDAGDHMPLQIDPVTPDELADVEQWVRDGARDDAFFQTNVAPIFGTSAEDHGKCVYCHYEDTPNPPNLIDPFGEDGVVNVDARYRADMARVEPGDPERSLLVLKIRLAPDAADSSVGAPMPFSYDPLSTRAVNTVRQWILEGARP